MVNFWRRTHAIHHAASCNLEWRNIGDVRSDRAARHEGG
jgi:fatty acid desaturase